MFHRTRTQYEFFNSVFTKPIYNERKNIYKRSSLYRTIDGHSTVPVKTKWQQVQLGKITHSYRIFGRPGLSHFLHKWSNISCIQHRQGGAPEGGGGAPEDRFNSLLRGRSSKQFLLRFASYAYSCSRSTVSNRYICKIINLLRMWQTKPYLTQAYKLPRVVLV